MEVHSITDDKTNHRCIDSKSQMFYQITDVFFKKN